MSNATLNRIIRKNEADANKAVSNIMLITFVLFTVIFVLNILGVFTIYPPAMSAGYFTSAVLLLSPKILNRAYGTSEKKLKYVYVFLASLFLLIVTSTLTFHTVLVHAYPIAIAGLYFSKKLTKLATVFTMIATSIGEFAGFFLDLTPDANYPDLYEFALHGYLPRFITLICFALLLQLLTVRTSNLLREDAENYEHLIAQNKEMTLGFATLVENRDENTGGHIKRTSIYAELLSRELQRKGLYTDIITNDFIECLASVAPLHDIGKLSIPDSILCKPGKLTDEEFTVMKSHSARGGDIIKEILACNPDMNYRQMAYVVAKYHHEKWNGRGYPEGLTGNDIPLAARIMAIADVFDAVSEKRCYRDAMPIDECFKIIEEGSGRDFDPIVADTFLEIKDTIIAARHNTNTNNAKNTSSAI